MLQNVILVNIAQLVEQARQIIELPRISFGDNADWGREEWAKVDRLWGRLLIVTSGEDVPKEMKIGEPPDILRELVANFGEIMAKIYILPSPKPSELLAEHALPHEDETGHAILTEPPLQ